MELLLSFIPFFGILFACLSLIAFALFHAALTQKARILSFLAGTLGLFVLMFLVMLGKV